MNMEKIKEMMKESIETKEAFLKEAEQISKAIDVMIQCYKNGNKILICGNGGSAADAQHIAAELVGRYKLERKGLPAIALTTDSSILTAWSNDYGFESVFERQVEALGKEGDVLIGLSTSGNSPNVVKAFEKARKMNLKTISLTGNEGGKLKPLSDININVSSKNTPRIQECHLLAYHIICEEVEKQMMYNNGGK